MKKILIFSLLLFSVQNFMFAQNKTIESLEKKLNQYTKSDTTRVNLLIEIALKLSKINNAKTLLYIDEAINLSDKLKYLKGKAESYRITGIYYYGKSDYPKVMEYGQKALKIFDEIGDKRGIAKCYNSIGIVYRIQGDYPKALECHQNALVIFEELGDKNGIAVDYNYIGIIYEYMDEDTKAMEYYQKSHAIREELKDIKGISLCYNNFAVIYKKQKKFLKALEYHKKSLKIEEEIGDINGIAISYYNISDINNVMGNYSDALEYSKKSLKLCIENGYKSLEAINYSGLGIVYLKLKKIQEAYNYGKKAYNIAKDIDNTEIIKESSETLSKCCEVLGLYKEAFEYHVIFKTMSDKMLNESNIKKIAATEYQYKYEKEKREQELEKQKKEAIYNAEIKQQAIIRNAFIVGFILMLLLAFFIFRNLRYSRRTNRILKNMNIEITEHKLSIEKQNLKLQELNITKDKFFSIIAHDLRGPVGNMKLFLNKMIEDDTLVNTENLNLLKDAANSTYNLLQNLLSWAKSQAKQINFNPESFILSNVINDTIKCYNTSAKIKNISLNYSNSDNLEVFADQNMLKTILRNLISNSIKFTNPGGKIDIIEKEENDQIEISVSDNGIGMNEENRNKLFRLDIHYVTSGTANEKGSGLGLILCKDFIETNGGKIWVEGELGKGSIFKFTLPKRI